MTENNKKITLDRVDSFFLKVFRIILLLIMSLALLGTVGSALYSAKLYFQDIKEPPKEPPSAQIDLNGLIKEFEKKSTESDGQQKDDLDSESIKTLKYLEDVTKLFRCSQAFASAVGAVVVEAGSEAASRNIENLRQQIESTARKITRGDPYVKDLVRFGCTALQSQEIIDFRKENKVQSVFLGIINYHLNAWDQIQIEREAAALKEKNRILADKADAITGIQISAVLFLSFMALALYLIFARIELNLRKISN
jgi:hypothetical protein